MSSKNQVRVIAGAWRGRKIDFPDITELRPTPNRIRETLFNWLQQGIVGKRCLDLYAGSGALGFEALSRGAKEVVFVDSNVLVTESLKKTLIHLGGAGEVVCSEAEKYCEQTDISAFDCIFLDPPFRQGHLELIIHFLNNKAFLNKGTVLYLEYETELMLTHDDSLLKIKEKTIGEVTFSLWKKGE